MKYKAKWFCKNTSAREMPDVVNSHVEGGAVILERDNGTYAIVPLQNISGVMLLTKMEAKDE